MDGEEFHSAKCWNGDQSYSLNAKGVNRRVLHRREVLMKISPPHLPEDQWCDVPNRLLKIMSESHKIGLAPVLQVFLHVVSFAPKTFSKICFLSRWTRAVATAWKNWMILRNFIFVAFASPIALSSVGRHFLRSVKLDRF